MTAPINNGGPAFPCGKYFDGMTLRDYFAGQALAGAISNWGNGSNTTSPWPAYAFTSEAAYRYADAMLAAREGKQ